MFLFRKIVMVWALTTTVALPALADIIDARDVLSRDMSAKWKAAGTDPASEQAKFDCAVRVGMAAFTVDELTALETYAAEETFTNFIDAEGAIKARDARLDMKALTVKECGDVPGFDPLF